MQTSLSIARRPKQCAKIWSAETLPSALLGTRAVFLTRQFWSYIGLLSLSLLTVIGSVQHTSASNLSIVQPSDGALFSANDNVTVVTALDANSAESESISLTIEGITEIIDNIPPYEFDLGQLPSGTHTITVLAAGSQESKSIKVQVVNDEDWRTIPGVFGAEDYYSAKGISVDYAVDYGWNQVLSKIDDDDWVKYMVDIESPGIYELVVRASNDDEANNASLNVIIDGQQVHQMSIDKTGGWLGWESLRSEIDLPAGQHELVFTFDGESSQLLELNWIEFHAVALTYTDLEISLHGLGPDQVLQNEMPLEIIAFDATEGATSGDGVDSVRLTITRNNDTLFSQSATVADYEFILASSDFGNGPIAIELKGYAGTTVVAKGFSATVTNHYDCNGDLNGSAYLDDCEMCIEGNTGNQSNDQDLDGIADCLDLCPSDPHKSNPGTCGCGIPDLDGDGDGVPNCIDVCAGGNDQVDNDLDGIPDDCDSDDDNDGVADFNDCFPYDKSISNRTRWYQDLDGDGKGEGRYLLGCEPPNATWVSETGDECPYDAERTVAGACGCGAPLEGCLGYVNSIGDLQNAKSNLIAFPNPTKAITTVTWQGHQIKTLALYTSTGQLLTDGGVESVDMSHLPNGFYVLLATDIDGQSNRTPVVKR